MHKKSNKTIANRTERASLISKTARICDVTERHVRHVLAGDRENETIFSTYMELREKSQELENNLINAVRNAVPL